MIQKILNKPQAMMLILGGWLFIFGLAGAISRSPALEAPSAVNQQSNNQTLKVEPAVSDPSSVIDQLQGAGNLQGQGGSDLQQPSDNQLQRNSGLSEFPSNSSSLQQ